MTDRKKLTVKQSAFVDEYVVDFNGTQAAIRAGYVKNGAGVTAVRLLTDPKITVEIRVALDARSKRIAVTQDRIILELARIAFSDLSNIVEWGPDGVVLRAIGDLTEDQTRTVQMVKSKVMTRYGKDGDEFSTVETQIKQHDKLRALDMLCRCHGMYIDKLEHSGPDGGPIPVENRTADVARAIVRNRLTEVPTVPTNGNGNGNGSQN